MILPVSPKLILYGLLAVGIGGSVLYVKHVFNDRERLEIALKESNLTRDTAVASAFLYQANNERQVKLLSEYQVKLDEKQALNSALERDVAANKRKLSIRGASCSASSTTANPGTAETAPQYSAEFRQSLFGIRSGIITLEENYALCLQILNEDRKKAPSK